MSLVRRDDYFTSDGKDTARMTLHTDYSERHLLHLVTYNPGSGDVGYIQLNECSLGDLISELSRKLREMQ